MRLWRIVATATVVEAAVLSAATSLLGLAGVDSAWFDLLNNFTPFWFALALLSAPIAAVLTSPGRVRWFVVGLAVISGVISGAMLLPELAASIALPHFGDGRPYLTPLKIVTFNTWSENTDPDAVVARVKGADPDAAALIEMSWALSRQRLQNLAAQYPYRTSTRRACQWDTVLISKRPFTSSGCETTASPDRPEVVETVVWGRTTAPDGRPFTLATTHYSWPFPHGGQGLQRAALARFVKAHADADMILTGDFNLTPWTFALRRQDQNLRPLTRRDHAIFTWPAMIARLDKPAPFAFLPIDHIYAGGAWRTERIARLARAGSDHYGIIAEFSRAP
jgi:endonuclease/exonuclease/phosphatase (EEP) superfamily protein YafD